MQSRVLNDSINYQDYYQDLTKFNSRWALRSSYQFKTQLLNLDKIIDKIRAPIATQCDGNVYRNGNGEGEI